MRQSTYPRIVGKDGYAQVYMPEHPEAGKSGYVREHIVVAEKALGKRLPDGAVVHHHDEVRSNNANTNLVICEDTAYHKHLHWRMNTNCGTEKVCVECGDMKPLSEFSTSKQAFRFQSRCKPCRSKLYGSRYPEAIKRYQEKKRLEKTHEA